jgi:hypothetical protein
MMTLIASPLLTIGGSPPAVRQVHLTEMGNVHHASGVLAPYYVTRESIEHEVGAAWQITKSLRPLLLVNAGACRSVRSTAAG